MNAVNAVQLFILVWIFPAVCRADDDVSCDDVTGTVGEDVIFTCSIIKNCSEFCITMYKFQYPEKYETICREDFPQHSCEQRKSFTCRYTPTTAVLEKFGFFVQRVCGSIKKGFTVNITEPSKPEITTEEPRKPKTVTEDHDKKEEPSNWEITQSKASKSEAEGRGFKVAVIAAVVSCFIIVIVPMIYKIKQNCKQDRRFLNNSQDRCPVNVV